MSRIKQRLAEIGEELGAIDAVLLTHEHIDHTAAVQTLLKTPVFRGHVYVASDLLGLVQAGQRSRVFEPGNDFQVGNLRIYALPVPHDAVAPVAFVLSHGMSRMAIATDLGRIPDDFGECITGTDVLFLEANHDNDMLAAGPYANVLKRRVASDLGHLSNDQVVEFISEDLHLRTSQLVLCHLSQSSNDPRLVRAMATRALRDRGCSARLSIVEYGGASEVFEC